jgi:hypothetical protein
VLNGVTARDFPAELTNFLATNTASLANAPTNAIDPISTCRRRSRDLVGEYEADLGPLGDGWVFGVDGYYATVNRGLDYVDLRSRQIGTLPDGRPRYTAFDNTFTNTNQDLCSPTTIAAVA